MSGKVKKDALDADVSSSDEDRDAFGVPRGLGSDSPRGSLTGIYEGLLSASEEEEMSELDTAPAAANDRLSERLARELLVPLQVGPHGLYPSYRAQGAGRSWNSKRSKIESRFIEWALDAAFADGLTFASMTVEGLARRYAALKMADEDGTWEAADGLMRWCEPGRMVSRTLRAALLRDAARSRRLLGTKGGSKE